MKAIVISDVHIGSPYCQDAEFLKFLENFPEDHELIMNGDIVDFWHADFSPSHQATLDALRKLSYERKVVWVHGNHDEGYQLEESSRIQFAESYSIGTEIYISHGYDFDNLMPYNRAFIVLFRSLHRLRIRLGADSVHVARYAKRWPLLYRVLLKHVAMNAVEYARENGYSCVMCGHTHHIEDRMIKGIHYVNTGSWTEPPIYCADVVGNSVTLRKIGDDDPDNPKNT